MSDDRRFYHGIWFVGDGSVDWMGSLFRADGKWVFEYRFRYYAGDDPFDGRDRKNWYTATMKDDSDHARQQAVKAVRELMPVLEAQFGRPVDFVDLDCWNDDPKFLFELGSRPWAHLQRVPGEQ